MFCHYKMNEKSKKKKRKRKEEKRRWDSTHSLWDLSFWVRLHHFLINDSFYRDAIRIVYKVWRIHSETSRHVYFVRFILFIVVWLWPLFLLYRTHTQHTLLFSLLIWIDGNQAFNFVVFVLMFCSAMLYAWWWYLV